MFDTMIDVDPELCEAALVARIADWNAPSPPRRQSRSA